MRPASHRDQRHERRCGNCKHAHAPEYKRDLLCFFGDSIEVERLQNGGVDVYLNGEDVGLMDGEEYSDVWGGRVVDPESEVCDQWEAEVST